ncbi:MAG TPA: hypothetical protein VK727_17420 [Steroidobacteraceae bacterium]|nr:hypothetical protein [Steroidobacteraceae bacterium]
MRILIKGLHELIPTAFYRSVTSTALSQFIQKTHGMIAGIQMVHIICLACVFALGLALALSLAGRGFDSESLDSLSRRFVPAIWIFVSVLLVTGALLIIAEPVRSLPKAVFYIKMALIVLAISMTSAIAKRARRAQRAGAPAPVSRAVAVVYMLIWCCIIVAGRMIAYY